MQHANKHDRVALVAASVEAGRTSDEERQNTRQETNRPRWLLAVDVSYFLHRFWFSGAGIEAASGVVTWVRRPVERLREKGLTDVVCCLDSPTNHRKEFTRDWEDKYKDRPPRDPELSHQLKLVHDLLQDDGFACVGVDGMEADDVMASYAKQFEGRVTLMTQDKDCRQCLSDKCNMLLDVTWNTDEHSADHVPTYQWVTAKSHTEATGITPHQWPEYQILMGDNTDGIKGAIGIGEKGAKELVLTFDTAAKAVESALLDDVRIKERTRKSLVDFASKIDVTRKLVTLRTDLTLPTTTRI
jgi:DNA polymerase-1